jgi:hypothetical protein
MIAIYSSTRSLKELEGKYQANVAIEACCGLLSDDDGVVRPIHFTVKEFLQENGGFVPDESEANAELARRSINYFLCGEFREVHIIHCGCDMGEDEEGCVIIPNGRIPLLYVFRCWNEHLRRATPLTTDLKDLLKYSFEGGNSHVPYYVRMRWFHKAPSVFNLCVLFGFKTTKKKSGEHLSTTWARQSIRSNYASAFGSSFSVLSASTSSGSGLSNPTRLRVLWIS